MPHLYEVGKLYSPNRTKWPENVEYNHRGGAHELRLFYPGPTTKEVSDVQSGQVRLALYPPASTNYGVSLDIVPSAQQIVEVRTSGVDRAKGFQIAIVPLAMTLGLLIVFVSLAFENELFSLVSLLLFWCTFALCWLIGWIATLLLSAEGVAFYEAHRKWRVVEREQEERWAHYRSNQ